MSRETTPRFGSIVTAAPGELHGAFGLIPPTAATRELVLDKSAVIGGLCAADVLTEVH
jgi:hypothetical protein